MSHIGTQYASMAAIAVMTIICSSMLFSEGETLFGTVVLFAGMTFVTMIRSCVYSITRENDGGKA